MNVSSDCRCPGCGECQASRLINLMKKASMKLEWKNFMLDALDGSGLTVEEIQLFMSLSDELGLED